MVLNKKFALFLCLAAALFLSACAATPKKVSREMVKSDLVVPADAEEKQGLARNYYEEGMTLYHSGKLVEAEGLLEKSLELDDSRARVHNNLGVIYQARKAYQDAERSFRLALEIEPEYRSARFNLGIALLRQDNYREALKIFKGLDEAKAKLEGLNMYIGLCYYGLKKPGMAIKYLNKALADSPDNAKIAYCIGISDYRLRAYVAAEDNLRKAVELDPDLACAYFYLATIKQTQDEYTTAAGYWKKFLEFPVSPQWQKIAQANLNKFK